MKCPVCSAEAAGDECPSCGLIFSKWKQRQERAKLEARAALNILEQGPAQAAVDLRRGRIIAGVFLAAWMIGLTLAARHHMRTRRVSKGRSAQAGEMVPFLDPKTGAVRMVKVYPAAPEVQTEKTVPPPPSSSGD